MGDDSRTRQLIIALVIVVACPGCGESSEVTCDDSGATLPCACAANNSLERCVGNHVEACLEGQWRVVESCASSERCVAGGCRGPAVSGCPDEARYEGGQTYRERYAPVAVSDCLLGSDLGRNISYHENQSDSRQRTLRFVGLSGCADPEAELPHGSLSPVFGVDVREKVTSDRSKSLQVSGHLWPGEFGMFYRQTTRVERVATLWRQGQFLGLAVLTDWIFAPDLAKGDSCPPASSLKPAATWPACLTADEGCTPCLAQDR